MEERTYAASEGEPPEAHSPDYAGDAQQAPARDDETLARIESKLDAVLAISGLGVGVDAA